MLWIGSVRCGAPESLCRATLVLDGTAALHVLRFMVWCVGQPQCSAGLM
jgi:hypothetical protein